MILLDNARICSGRLFSTVHSFFLSFKKPSMLYYFASLSFISRFSSAIPLYLQPYPNTSLCFISFWAFLAYLQCRLTFCAISFSPRSRSHLCYPCLNVHIFFFIVGIISTHTISIPSFVPVSITEFESLFRPVRCLRDKRWT